MSKYFDGYASFDWNEMSNQKLIVELKEKCRYIAELKQIHKEKISTIQSSKDQQIAQLKAENERLKKYETIYYLNQLQASNEDINKFKQNQIQQSINISDLLKDNTKQVRKEVCEELKND